MFPWNYGQPPQSGVVYVPMPAPTNNAAQLDPVDQMIKFHKLQAKILRKQKTPEDKKKEETKAKTFTRIEMYMIVWICSIPVGLTNLLLVKVALSALPKLLTP